MSKYRIQRCDDDQFNPGWDVVAPDGTVVVECETYTVASEVEYRLNNPGRFWEPDEIAEVVDRIVQERG